jgi:hypothetical protein
MPLAEPQDRSDGIAGPVQRTSRVAGLSRRAAALRRRSNEVGRPCVRAVGTGGATMNAALPASGEAAVHATQIHACAEAINGRERGST